MKIKRRISMIALSLLLVTGSIFSKCNTITSHAAMELESSIEMTMLLYSILESAMIASGVKECLDDKL